MLEVFQNEKINQSVNPSFNPEVEYMKDPIYG